MPTCTRVISVCSFRVHNRIRALSRIQYSTVSLGCIHHCSGSAENRTVSETKQHCIRHIVASHCRSCRGKYFPIAIPPLSMHRRTPTLTGSPRTYVVTAWFLTFFPPVTYILPLSAAHAGDDSRCLNSVTCFHSLVWKL